MAVLRSWKYRIYPTKDQEKEFQFYLYECKNLWNELLEYTKQYYDKTGAFPTNYQFNYLIRKKSSIWAIKETENFIERESYEMFEEKFDHWHFDLPGRSYVSYGVC